MYHFKITTIDEFNEQKDNIYKIVDSSINEIYNCRENISAEKEEYKFGESGLYYSIFNYFLCRFSCENCEKYIDINKFKLTRFIANVKNYFLISIKSEINTEYSKNIITIMSIINNSIKFIIFKANKLSLINYLFFIILIYIIYYDIKFKIIPNFVTLPGIAIGLFFAIIYDSSNILNYILGAFALSIPLAIYFNNFIGAGVIKLVSLIGSFVGINLQIYIIIMSTVFLLIHYVIFKLIKTDRDVCFLC